MIQITILRKNNKILHFTITGHAAINQEDVMGKIVCGAVSVLAQNTINALNCYTNDDFEYVLQEGDNATIAVTFKEEPSNDANLLLNTLVMGCNSIMQTEPQRINIVDTAM